MFEQIVGAVCLIFSLILFVTIKIIEYVQYLQMTSFK